MSLDDYLRENYTASTAKIYAFEIGRYLVGIGGEQAALVTTYADLVGSLAQLRRRYARPATVNRMLYAIKAYYRYLVASGRRADFPGSRLTLRDLDRSGIQNQDLLSAEELTLLLRPRPERYPVLKNRNAVAIGLLVHQAMTVREVGSLKVGDIDLAGVTVRTAGSHRTEARRLKLTATQILPLQSYLTEDRPRLLRRPTDHLLLTQRGTAERGEGIHYLIETLRPLVAGKRLTPTSIRQSVIAQRLKAGHDLRKVQAFAGHKKVSATEVYRENNLEELRRAVDRFHPLGQSKSH